MKQQNAWALWCFLLAISTAHADVVLVGITGIANNSGPTAKLVDINLVTGAASNPRETGILAIAGIASQPLTGQLFGLTTAPSTPANTLVRFNVLTGTPTVIGSTGLPLIIEGDLAFNPANGFLYGLADLGSDSTHRNLFQINPSTGAATIIADLPSNSNSADYSSLAFNALGTLYCIDDGPAGNSRLLTIDPTSGAIASNIAMNIDLGSGNGMAFDPETGNAYVADGTFPGTGLLYSLDVNDGMLTSIGSLTIPGGVVGLTFVAVPEPSSVSLLILPIWAACRRVRTCRNLAAINS